MRRDMNMVRRILMVLEENHEDEPISTHFFDKGREFHMELVHHVRLLSEEGMIHTVRGHSLIGDDANLPYALTWKGYDFLNCVRSDHVWEALCAMEVENGYPLPSDVLLQLAKQMVRQRVGLDNTA